MRPQPHLFDDRRVRRYVFGAALLMATVELAVFSAPVPADDTVADQIEAQGRQALTRMSGDLRDSGQWQDAGQRRLRELLEAPQDPNPPYRFADQGERG
jgi:hypothetical protein